MTLLRPIRWPAFSLPAQFLLAGAAVMVAAMLIVGSWVANTIRDAVVQHSALSAAQLVENLISPIGQELALSSRLSEPARLALDELFAQPPLQDRVVSYKIWLPDGTVAYASNPEIVGKRFEPGDDLRAALRGEIHASYEYPDAEENRAEAALGVPLLEVYMPLHEDWTNEIIGAVEFYERNDALPGDLFRTRMRGWLVVGATFLVSGVLLFGIVQAGGRTIRRQEAMLREQLELTRRISDQNAQLQRRATTASARAVAKSERMMRQLGSDLHDGPAQYLSLAALRLDEVLPPTPEAREAAAEIRAALDTAMAEIRLLSRGLLLPDLDELDLPAVIARAVSAHERASGSKVSVSIAETCPDAPGYAQKLCVFRVLQETLSNAARHAPGAAVRVACAAEGGALRLSIEDDGPGFDPEAALRPRSEGGQGLIGLRDRAESIGGSLAIESRSGAGTRIVLTLPLEQEETNR